MADTNPTPVQPAPATVKDVLHAPVVYFEGSPNFGNNHGIINITLVIGRHLANSTGGVDSDVVAVAHLRCNIPAAIDLRNTLNNALLLGAPVSGGDKAN